MEDQKSLQNKLSFIRSIALFELGILVGVAIICFVIGWRNLYQYGTALTIAGMIVIVYALITMVGRINSVKQDITAYSWTRSGDMNQHLKRSYSGTKNRFGHSIRFIVVGCISIIIGFLIQSIAVM